MHPPVSAALWAAIRAFCEGAPPTFPLAAAMTGLHISTIRERASIEKWAKLNFQSSARRAAWSERALSALEPSPAPTEMGDPPEMPEGWLEMTPDEQRAWVNAYVARQIARIAATAEATGGAPDKARMDGLLSMMRVVEKSGTLAQERASDNETGSDEEFAEKLRQIDDRIVELAEAHARWLVGERSRTGMD